ncbi:hypothetical protein [Silvibacterium sp.]|uniref:hypothetical protein n=1 Tax=Silvibacterium sp. TaxID=1964179 RepID=UPI0039E4286F
MKNAAAGSFALFAATVLFAGSAFAQNAAPALTLMSGDAVLTRSLNTKSAAPGQIVTVELTSSVHTSQGVDLPRGTKLLGKVESVSAAKDQGPSKLVLTFNQAQLKGGKTVQVKATLVSLSSGDQADEIPEAVSTSGVFDEVASGIGDTTMHSEVKADNSGTLSSQRGDIKLASGTKFLVAVDTTASQTANGAE